jgi:hypothetical protein
MGVTTTPGFCLFAWGVLYKQGPRRARLRAAPLPHSHNALLAPPCCCAPAGGPRRGPGAPPQHRAPNEELRPPKENHRRTCGCSFLSFAISCAAVLSPAPLLCFQADVGAAVTRRPMSTWGVWSSGRRTAPPGPVPTGPVPQVASRLPGGRGGGARSVC